MCPRTHPAGQTHTSCVISLSAEAQAVCAAIVDDPAYRKKLIARAKAGELAPAIEAMLWHYAYGKPKEQVEHSGTVETVSRIVHEHQP